MTRPTSKNLATAGVIAVAVFIAIQFIPFPIDPVTEDPSAAIQVSQPVGEIMKKACFDCHSNQTRLPWYGKVAPMSWLVVHDINDARKHLNFSLWARYPADKKLKKLKEVVEEVEEGEMPLASYRLLHSEARLTDSERNQIVEWFKNEVNRSQGSGATGHEGHDHP